MEPASLLWDRYFAFLKRFRFLLLLLFVPLTISAVFFAMKLRLESDLLKLLPANNRSLIELGELKQSLGGFGFLIVILDAPWGKPGTALSEEEKQDRKNKLLEQADHMAAALKADPLLDAEIRDIYYDTPVSFFRRYAMLYLEMEDLKKIHSRLEKKIAWEIRQANPYFLDIEEKPVRFYTGDIVEKYRKKNIHYDIFLDRNFTRIALFLKPKKPATDIEYSASIFNRVKAVSRGADLPQGWSIHLAGKYAEEPAQKSILNQDIAKTSLLTSLILFLAVIVFFRSLRAVLLIGLPLASGILWTFALTAVIIGHISLISSFLASILLGLGIDYGIHLYSRFREERLANHGVTESLKATYRSLISSIGLGALTTALAFLSIAFAHFRAFSEFGLMAFLGIICCLIAFLILFPLLIFITEPMVNEVTAPMKVMKLNYRRIPFFLLIGAGLNITGIFSLFLMKFEYNFSRLSAVSPEMETAERKLKTIIDRSENPIVFRVEDLGKLRALHETVKSRANPYVDQTQSILMFLPGELEKKKRLVSQIRLLLSRSRYLVEKNSPEERNLDRGLRLSDVGDFSLDKLPPHILRLLRIQNGAEEEYFYYIYPVDPGRNRRGIVDFAEANREICIGKPDWNNHDFCPPPDLVRGSSDSILLAEILDIILTDVSHGVEIIVVVIITLLIFLLRRLAAITVVLLPLFSGILSAFALLWLVDLTGVSPLFRLNYINIITLPVLIGLGIDNGLHLYRRIAEYGVTDMRSVISETGSAIFLSNMTTAVGFLSLTFSSHRGLASLGILTGTGILSVFAAYMVLFPLLVRIFNRGGRRVF